MAGDKGQAALPLDEAKTQPEPKAPVKATPEKPDEPTPEEKAEVQSRALEDEFCADVARRTVPHKLREAREGAEIQPYETASLDERMLAIAIELGRLSYDAERSALSEEKRRAQGGDGAGPKFPYHSIQQISRHVNRLQFKYRMRITTKMLESREVGNTVKVRIEFQARTIDLVGPSVQTETWEWEDDGSDLSKAGAYAVKYGIMRANWVSDGIDPDEEDGGVKTRPASGSRKASATPRGKAGAPGDAGGVPEVTAGQLALLNRLGAVLETKPDADWWGEPKIDGRLKRAATTWKNGEKSPFQVVLTEILKSHDKACGKDCEHAKFAKEKLSEMGLA